MQAPELHPEPRELPQEPERGLDTCGWVGIYNTANLAEEPKIVFQVFGATTPKDGPADYEIVHTLADATRLGQNLIKGARAMRERWQQDVTAAKPLGRKKHGKSDL